MKIRKNRLLLGVSAFLLFSFTTAFFVSGAVATVGVFPKTLSTTRAQNDMVTSSDWNDMAEVVNRVSSYFGTLFADSNNNGKIDEADKISGLSAADLAAQTSGGGAPPRTVLNFDGNVSCPSDNFLKISFPKGVLVRVSEHGDIVMHEYYDNHKEWSVPAPWTWFHTVSNQPTTICLENR